MKSAFAAIRNRYTEHMAARARGLIQTPKKPTGFGASAKYSKNPKLLTVSHEEQRLFGASSVAACIPTTRWETQVLPLQNKSRPTSHST
jgi:hypothetical protein